MPDWVKGGRITVLTDEELLGVIDEGCKALGVALG